MIPITPDRQVLFIRQFRFGIEDDTLEILLLNSFETGSVQGTMGELPLAADFTAPLESLS